MLYFMEKLGWWLQSISIQEALVSNLTTYLFILKATIFIYQGVYKWNNICYFG